MPEEAAETKMSLHDIPVLQGTDTYAAWKRAVVNKLRIDGIAGIIDGSEVEPYRLVEPSRLTRAGSAPPTALESETEKELTAEERKEWRAWQRKEVKVQGIISSTISEGIAYDAEDLPSAKAMWDHIAKRHRLDTPEEQANIMAALAMLRLAENSDPTTMEAHVESFNKLMMRAKTASIKFSEEERVNRFLASLPSSYKSLRHSFRMLDATKRTWEEAMVQFNMEVSDARRDAEAVVKEGKGSALFTKKRENNKNNQDKRSTSHRTRDPPKGECFNCKKKGHWAKDCWANDEKKGKGAAGKGKKGPNFKKDQKKQGQRRGNDNNDDDDDGDAMVADADEDPAWSLTTIGFDKGESKWKWDEDYGMSSSESDDDQTMPGEAQKSQPQGWSSSCGRLLNPEQLSTERSVDHIPNLLRTELTKDGDQDRSNRMGGLKLKLPIIDYGTSEEASARKTSMSSARKTSSGQMVLMTTTSIIRWIVDSGATHHMTWQREALTDLTRLASPLIFNTAGEHRLEATHKGTVRTRLPNGRTLTINDVYHVPGSRVNLLSTDRMVKSGWSVSLTEKGGRIKKGQASLTLSRQGGLWRAEWPATSKAPGGQMTLLQASSPRALSRLGEEHRRLGHIGRDKLLDLAKEGKLTGWTPREVMSDPFALSDCDVCQQYKATRRPKKKHSPRGKRNAELIHVDITGPFTPSLTGNDHLLVMMDDFSKICGLVPMIGKAASFEELKSFTKLVERQLGEKVRFIRSDNGGEFDSTMAREWYRSKGIIHQRTTVYTPELNGTVERFMRTIKGMISAMVADAGLGHEYWDHAARYASVVLMKTQEAANGVNAWKALTGRAPNLDSVIKFGSMCFVQVPKETRTKASFDTAKAELARVLGQDAAVSGWIVRMERSGKLVRSRDIRLATGMVMPAIPRTTNPSRYVRVDSDDIVPEEEEEEPTEPATTNGPPEEVITEEPLSSTEQPQPPRASQESRIPRPTRKPRWEYVPIVEQEPAEVPTATIDEQGRRRNAPRQTRTLPPRRHDENFLYYTGPNARNAYLAAEMVPWALATGFDKDEPRDLKDALSGGDAGKWKEAMNKELTNLREKGTWQEVLTPANRKKVGSKWVLKIKRDAEGNIVKHKARLVAKGYSQVPGVDFEETYAPVGRTTSLRILLTAAATLDLEILQADVEGAYLNGNLDVDIYMEYPQGVTPKKGCDGLLLKKSLYGLKQSGRTWWIEMGNKLARLGFNRLESDWGLYVRPKNRKNGLIIILVYVDDFIIAGESRRELQELLERLKGFWKLSEMGEVSTILGMKVTRNRRERKIWITQPAYVDQLLERFPNHTSYRNWAAPITKTTGIDDTPAALTPYQEIVGCLQWLASCTRPDISYTASLLARYSNNPTGTHWEMALRATSYLASTRNLGLELGGHRSSLEGWVDADWAGCHDTRRSTTGYVFKINGSAITWCSRRQQTVASSTVEAEYIATAEAAREAVWLRNLLKELGFKQVGPTTLHVDNQGAMRLATNPSTHQRTKHIDIKHHLIRELIDRGTIELRYVATEKQQADLLTKALPGPRHSSNSIQLRVGPAPIKQSRTRPSPARGGVLKMDGSGMRIKGEDLKRRTRKKVGDNVSGRYLRHGDNRHGTFYCA
jgi:transposase InsO family protein